MQYSLLLYPKRNSILHSAIISTGSSMNLFTQDGNDLVHRVHSKLQAAKTELKCPLRPHSVVTCVMSSWGSCGIRQLLSQT